ncbi:MAG: N-acetylmuramoyl-L-alanine amidase, partial [Clostridia bacterium]|nr:N-acetylmuramoyl-L-alanine amidase [Deltaproteobacteria bacterium]
SGASKALIVDISPATLGRDGVKVPQVDDALVIGAHVEARGPDKVRLTLELAHNVRQRIMVLENPYRIVVDLYRDEDTSSPKAAIVAHVGKRRVVIDPGHGGKDVGAIGPGKHYEKDLALAIAKATAAQLIASGIDARLTRDDDTFVPLEGRTAIANKGEADLFVSIHLNAAKNAKARGVETYYLDTTNDRYALRLAARENRTSEDRVSETELILADLATKAAVQEAKKLASRVQKSVYDVAHGTDASSCDHGIKSSLFYVLLGARMPAVLVETGFISNAAEEKLLAGSVYQQKLGRAIAQAVRESLKVPVAVAREE